MGECVFVRCEALKEVNIPQNLTAIPYGTFSACFRLKDVTIPESVKTIEDYAFFNCGSIKNLVIPDSVESVDTYSFYTVTNIICSNEELINELKTDSCGYENMFVPKNINGYNDGEFFYEDETKTVLTGCMADGAITIPETVKEIKYGAFTCCNNITEVTIPNTVETIGAEIFGACYDLKKVVISEGISTIPYGTFNTCKGLEEVILPESIRTIDSCAFIACTSLESIDLPNVDMEIWSDAFFCSGLKSIVIPENLTKMSCCFWGCQNLTKITVNSDLTTDDSSYPFVGCYYISDVILLGEGNVAFDDIISVQNIYCDNEKFDCEKLYAALKTTLQRKIHLGLPV